MALLISLFFCLILQFLGNARATNVKVNAGNLKAAVPLRRPPTRILQQVDQANIANHFYTGHSDHSLTQGPKTRKQYSQEKESWLKKASPEEIEQLKKSFAGKENSILYSFSKDVEKINPIKAAVTGPRSSSRHTEEMKEAWRPNFKSTEVTKTNIRYIQEMKDWLKIASPREIKKLEASFAGKENSIKYAFFKEAKRLHTAEALLPPIAKRRYIEEMVHFFSTASPKEIKKLKASFIGKEHSIEYALFKEAERAYEAGAKAS